MTVIDFKRRYYYRTDFSGYNLPNEWKIALDRYIQYGIFPGSLLKSILSNNLIETVNRADADVWKIIPIVTAWMFHKAPSCCWGSAEAVDNYMLDKKASLEMEKR